MYEKLRGGQQSTRQPRALEITQKYNEDHVQNHAQAFEDNHDIESVHRKDNKVNAVQYNAGKEKHVKRSAVKCICCIILVIIIGRRTRKEFHKKII